MQTFTGTKTVQARPMTRGAYSTYRGWPAPEGEDQAVNGYLVEYTDGGTPNDPRHDGYISWSPADVFERSYKQHPTKTGDGRDLTPYQVCVVMEKADLAVKVGALQALIDAPDFAALTPVEAVRLKAQLTHMSRYLDTLQHRIAAF